MFTHVDQFVGPLFLQKKNTVKKTLFIPEVEPLTKEKPINNISTCKDVCHS